MTEERRKRVEARRTALRILRQAERERDAARASDPTRFAAASEEIEWFRQRVNDLEEALAECLARTDKTRRDSQP